MPTEDDASPTDWSGFSRRWLELFGLTGFGIAQPIYDQLGRHANFFVAQDLSPGQILLVGLLVSAGFPTLVALSIELLGLASSTFAMLGHRLALGVLASLIVLHSITSNEFTGATTVVIAVFVTALVSWGYASSKHLRGLLGALSPAGLVFPAIFFFATPVHDLLGVEVETVESAAHIERPAPIVLMIFDEFPVISLLDQDGTIDARRYPHFASFARDSVWYENTSTVSIYTEAAVPAILTGLYPEKPFSLATHEHMPRSIYSLFGRHYQIHNFEAITQLCPARLCPEDRDGGTASGFRGALSDISLVYLHLISPPSVRARLPAVTQNWKNFAREGHEASTSDDSSDASGTTAEKTGRNQKKVTREIVNRALSTQADFETFLATMRRPKPAHPTLHVFHMLLPHPPWRYLPSGHRYPEPRDWRYGVKPHWSRDTAETQYAYQRHLLQVGYADRVLGQLTRRLRALEIYREALIVVVADHGASFMPTESRRDPSTRNAAETLMVPFFIKYPGAARIGVDERTLQTIDVLPTIAEAVGAEIPWPVDGHSAIAADFPDRTGVTVVRNNIEDESFGTDTLARTRAEALARKVRLFGDRRGNQGLFHTGKRRDLVGQPLSGIPLVPKRGSLKAQIWDARQFSKVDMRRSELPTLVEGRLVGMQGEPRPIELAIAVNSRVAAVVPSYRDPEGQENFAAMISRGMLLEGTNRVSILRVIGSGRDTRMMLIGTAGH